jgi:hypothetical protein
MPIPEGRPVNVIAAIRKGFDGHQIWPMAITDPTEASYQNLALTHHYIDPTPGGEGFALTDLGRREITQG